MPNPMPPANIPPFRFHHGARADWYFDMDDCLVFSKSGPNGLARIVMKIPEMLNEYKETGAMKTNATYDKNGNLLVGEKAAVAIAKDEADKNRILEDMRYDSAKYLGNHSNGVYGGAHLVIVDTNKNDTYDEGEPVEIILSGKDDDYNDIMVGMVYNHTTQAFEADLDHFYTFKPDSKGGGNFVKGDVPTKFKG